MVIYSAFGGYLLAKVNWITRNAFFYLSAGVDQAEFYPRAEESHLENAFKDETNMFNHIIVREARVVSMTID